MNLTEAATSGFSLTGERLRAERIEALAELAPGEHLMVCAVADARPCAPLIYTYLGTDAEGASVLFARADARPERHPAGQMDAVCRQGWVFALRSEDVEGADPVARAAYAVRYGVDPEAAGEHLLGQLVALDRMWAEVQSMVDAFPEEGGRVRDLLAPRMVRLTAEMDAVRRGLLIKETTG